MVANDTMAQSVINVLKSQGLAGKVAVSGQDATAGGLDNTMSGTQCFTIYKPVAGEADTAVKLASEILAGQKPAAPATTKDPASGREVPSFLADPTVITKANAAKPVTDGYVSYAAVCSTTALQKLCVANMRAPADELIDQEVPDHEEPAGAMAALAAYLRGYLSRLRGGELGSAPALAGLVVITAVFSVVHQGFLSAYNIEALVIQAAPIIVMAMGLVAVLLLGEIDLSAGTTGGLCSAIMAVLMLRHGVPWWLGIIIALAAGLAIGLGMGVLRARLGIPSFVITLATFLAFQGVTLILVGGQGSVNLPANTPVVALENSFLPLWLGWVLLAVFIAGYASVKLNDAVRRSRAGLAAAPLPVIVAKIVVLAVLGSAFTYIMGVNRNLSTNAFFANKAQGVPWVVLLLVILDIVFNFYLTRTRYGRHVYAVGGNDEAARRAGIVVSRIRVSVFVICSFMAAVSGLIAASLLQSVQSNAGAGNTLLLAVGAAVIGGTSLFGGRGRVIDAVLGGLVVAVIVNGMSDLIQGANSAGYEWIVTGVVLLVAAGFDAVVRRAQSH